MNAHALDLRAISNAEASARQRIGSGLSLPFELDQQQGWLDLRLSASPNPARHESQLDSAAGALRLTEAEALLGLLSSCPALMPHADSANDEHNWYWQLYNHYLSPELQDLFGDLQPLDAPPAQGLDCLLQARINGLRVSARLSAAPDAA